MNKLNKITVYGVVVLSLASCGGNNNEEIPVVYEDLLTATGEVDVKGISLKSSTAATGTTSLSFNGSSDSVNVNNVSVALVTDDLRSKASDGSSLDYVSVIENAGGDVKMVAIQTVASDMPSRTAKYYGNSDIALTTGAGTYLGGMTTTTEANFSSNTLNVEMSGLTLNDPQFATPNGVESAYTSNGSESIVLSDIKISGAGFSDQTSTTLSVSGFGTADSTTTFLSPSINVSGVFAGPEATEIAGAATVKGDGGRQLFTTFSGQQ